ncbi:hypothetical protein [Moorena producens]|uniref:hypothetical protein n=1 Tax=Moorena producens TaxID=1155739 RepID=UPI003C796C01
MQRGLGEAARSWGGSAVLGVSPMSDCRGPPHDHAAVVSPTRALHQDIVSKFLVIGNGELVIVNYQLSITYYLLPIPRYKRYSMNWQWLIFGWQFNNT